MEVKKGECLEEDRRVEEGSEMNKDKQWSGNRQEAGRGKGRGKGRNEGDV